MRMWLVYKALSGCSSCLIFMSYGVLIHYWVLYRWVSQAWNLIAGIASFQPLPRLLIRFSARKWCLLKLLDYSHSILTVSCTDTCILYHTAVPESLDIRQSLTFFYPDSRGDFPPRLQRKPQCWHWSLWMTTSLFTWKRTELLLLFLTPHLIFCQEILFSDILEVLSLVFAVVYYLDD